MVPDQRRDGGMSGSHIAAGLLLAVLSFALAFAPRRTALQGAALALLATAVAIGLPPIPAGLAFAAGWITLGLAALSVYWPGIAQRHAWLCMIFAINAGGWAGVLAAAERPGLSALPIVGGR
jgi:hypothetical protein